GGTDEQGAFGVTVCTFNVLAEALEPTGCAVSFDARKDGLLQEILRSQAEIVCLQEVDHFQDFFRPVLEGHGYEGYFVPKTKKPKGSANVTEGQAIFVRRDRLHVERAMCWTSIDLAEKKFQKLRSSWMKQTYTGALRLEQVFGTAEALQVVPQVVLGLFLRPKGQAAPFLVTNMHLKSRVKEEQLPAGMDYTAFKHFQLEHFLSAAAAAAEQYAPGTSVLCCGDMNLCLLGDPGAAQVVGKQGFQDTGATSAGGTARSPVDFILARSAPGTIVAQAALELPAAIDYTQQLP
ncbi:CCR4-1, partial [Symbiodinium sp. CCMP2456]